MIRSNHTSAFRVKLLLKRRKRPKSRYLGQYLKRKRASKRFKTKEFLSLQKEWYDKLKDDGFDDIEYVNPRTGDVDPRLDAISEADIHATWTWDKQRYYELARQWVWTLRAEARRAYERYQYAVSTGKSRVKGKTVTRLRNEWKRAKRAFLVWEMHSEGLSTRKIEKKLGISHMTTVQEIKKERARMLNEAIDNP